MPKLGSMLLRLDNISSTNDVARELAVSGAAEGLCVVASHQTAGRGRQSRSWSSPPGEGLYLSLVLRPVVTASASAIMTLAAAVAVAETLECDFETAADIKWPNDVLVSGRKICGILVESAVEGERLQYAVMGIGVNIAQRSFPAQIGDTATSLLIETGRAIKPEDFMQAMLPRLEDWYSIAMSDPARVIVRWEETSSSGRDCEVRVESSDGAIEGVTRGLTLTGALIVELAGGQRREIVAGDVRVRTVVA